MKASFLPIALGILLAVTAASPGFMLPEDKIGKEFWDTLDAKTKPVFLMGFRHGIGPQPGGPATKTGFLVLSAEHFPKLIERMDAFYAIKANKDVCLRLAVQICLMQMTGKAQADIDRVTKEARNLVYTAY